MKLIPVSNQLYKVIFGLHTYFRAFMLDAWEVYSCSLSLSLSRCGSKNGHQTYLCVNKIGLWRAPNLLIVMGLIVNMIGRGSYGHSTSMGNFTLMTSQGRWANLVSFFYESPISGSWSAIQSLKFGGWVIHVDLVATLMIFGSVTFAQIKLHPPS